MRKNKKIQTAYGEDVRKQLLAAQYDHNECSLQHSTQLFVTLKNPSFRHNRLNHRDGAENQQRYTNKPFRSEAALIGLPAEFNKFRVANASLALLSENATHTPSVSNLFP